MSALGNKQLFIIPLIFNKRALSFNMDCFGSPLFHMGFMSAAGTGNYATKAAASQKSDLVLDYERLSLEIAQYDKDGADIMNSNEWLEQPFLKPMKNSILRMTACSKNKMYH